MTVPRGPRRMRVGVGVRVIGPMLMLVRVRSHDRRMLEARIDLLRRNRIMVVAPRRRLPRPLVHHEQAPPVVALLVIDVEVLLALVAALLLSQTEPFAVRMPDHPRRDRRACY